MSQNILPVAGFFECAGSRSTDEIVARLPRFRWEVHPGAKGGKIAYAVVSGNKETGEVWVLAILEDAKAPAHEHIAGGSYGEMIVTFSGCLLDVADDGKPVQLLPGSILEHRGGSIHAPEPLKGPDNAFWFGLYYQPRGSRLVAS